MQRRFPHVTAITLGDAFAHRHGRRPDPTPHDARHGFHLQWLAVIILVLTELVSAAGTTSASFTVRVQVLPTREQKLMSAQLTVRQPDGSSVTLTREQKAMYIKDPASILQATRPTDGTVVISVEY